MVNKSITCPFDNFFADDKKDKTVKQPKEGGGGGGGKEKKKKGKEKAKTDEKQKAVATALLEGLKLMADKKKEAAA